MQTMITLGAVPVRMSLAEYLRNVKGLMGTKLSCQEGGCGACTVTLKRGSEIRQANACLRPVLSLDGWQVVTVEGLKNGTTYDPVQRKMAECDGTQCGMCTPGMIMSIYGFLQKNKSPTKVEAESCIQGNRINWLIKPRQNPHGFRSN